MEYKDFTNKHRTDWQDFLWNKFLEQFPGAQSKDAVNSIFSVYEKRLITRRLAAIALLKEGRGSSEIGRILWLSRATISALKKSFFNRSGNYIGRTKSKKIDRRVKEVSTPPLSKRSWLDDLFGEVDIWEIIKNPPRPRGMGLKK